jgi:hypothetical protein
MQPCQKAYNTERSWVRKRFKFRDGVPENLSLFPSKEQFAILKANGYITGDSPYDLKRTPDFDPCWLGPRYDLRELSIRSPFLPAQQQQQQQQRKFVTPKSRRKPAPQYTGRETTNTQAMLRTFESIQRSQQTMFQQAVEALSARGQIPPPPQSQSQPTRSSEVYDSQRGSNVSIGRNSRVGTAADTSRPTSISKWARDVPQHPRAQSETTRDIRPLKDRMTYDTQSDAGPSSERPRARSQYPSSNKRERSPSAHQGSITFGRNEKRPFSGRDWSQSRAKRSQNTSTRRLEDLRDVNADFNSSSAPTAHPQHDAERLEDLRDENADSDDPDANYHP